jgi:glyoxylase-like metal-dependent hydrolase (beta-lactamase superfamily II)
VIEDGDRWVSSVREAPLCRRTVPAFLWARVPLPFQLNHVNVYIIDDGDGWTIFDTRIDDATTRKVWEEMIAGPLYGRRITRLIVSHFHPDHIGLADH